MMFFDGCLCISSLICLIQAQARDYAIVLLFRSAVNLRCRWAPTDVKGPSGELLVKIADGCASSRLAGLPRQDKGMSILAGLRAGAGSHVCQGARVDPGAGAQVPCPRVGQYVLITSKTATISCGPVPQSLSVQGLCHYDPRRRRPDCSMGISAETDPQSLPFQRLCQRDLHR